MSNLLRPGEYAYIMATEENGTETPVELVKLLEQDNNGYWTVEFESGFRTMFLPAGLMSIDDNRMLEWGNKAKAIRNRNMPRLTRSGGKRSRRRKNRRSTRRSRRH